MTVAELIAELQKRDPEKEVYVALSNCACFSSEPLEVYHIHDTNVRDGWDFNNRNNEVVLFGYEA